MFNNNEKNVSNLNFSLAFVGKIKLNCNYVKMTKKMYDNLQEKYKNSLFQILIHKASYNSNFNSSIRKNNTLSCAIVWE